MNIEKFVPDSLAATKAISDSAFAALWPVLKRQNAEEVRGFSEFAQWRAHFVFMHFRARHLDRILIEKCRDVLNGEDIFDDEREDLLRVIKMSDALRAPPESG